MKKKFILTLISASVIFASAFTILDSNGIAYETGSPSDGSTCSSCHSGGTATTVPSLVASPAFGGSGNALTYVPGTTYTITVKETGYTEFGFDVEIMNSNSASATTDAGTMTAISTNCKKNGTGPTNITHNTPIATASSATFKWVAPASGTAYLYAAILGVNGNGSTSGDKVSNLAYVLTVATGAVPVAAFNTSATSVCSGQSISLTDASTNTPTSWAWTMTGGTPATSTTQNPTVSYATSGTYTVSLISSNASGSSSSVSKTITVNAVPNVTSTSTTSCAGQSASITASGATTYLWNTGGTNAVCTKNPTATTSYTVTGTTNTCTNTAVGTINVNQLPVITAPSQTVCTATSATITAGGATTYSWNTGATGASIIVSPTTATTYTVTGISSVGCSNTATSTVSLKTCGAGISNNAVTSLISVYPNPASETLNINLGVLSGETIAEIYDISGRLVMSQNTNESSMQVNLTKIANGTYFIKLINEKTVVASKMILVSK